jgi:hypothetical protein
MKTWFCSLAMVLAAGAMHCSAPVDPAGDIQAPGRGVGGGTGDPNATKPNDTTSPPSSGSNVDPKPAPPSDPGASCDASKPFGSPAPVLGLPADMHLATPRLASDERTIYFTMHVGGVAKLGRAIRPTAATPFEAPQVMSTLVSDAKDNDPAPSADGKMLWFSSERSGSGDELFVATRNDPTAEFGAPARVEGVGSSGDEQHPWYRSSAEELWFSSSRNGMWEVYVTQRVLGGPFRTPIRVEELRGDASTRQPMVTEDGLTIVFASERSGGAGKRDLWLSHRATENAAFDKPTPIKEVNSGADEFGGWLSADGCRLYFSSDREVAKRHRIYMATRPK